MDRSRKIMTDTTPISTYSPCINVCVINAETGYCHGCYRTVDEISGWLQFSHAEKVQIISALKTRATEGGD